MVVATRSPPPSGVETSLPFAIASPPRDRIRPATCSATSESFPNPDTSVPRSFTTTRAPRSARSSTYARPSPRPAPVTTTTFPSNEIRSVISPSASDSARGSSHGSDAKALDSAEAGVAHRSVGHARRYHGAQGARVLGAVSLGERLHGRDPFGVRRAL